MKDPFGTISIQKHQLTYLFTQDDLWQYISIPFDVPEHALQIKVSFPSSAPGRHDVIDLAIEEPDGALRGATGGARKDILISPNGSTPGYRIGPLPAGEWAVVLGCYQLSPGSIAYEFTVEVTTGQDLVFVGDLHCHSEHSDGRHTVTELAELAVERGLDFLAITDHNNIAAHPEIPRVPDLTLLRGMEITWYEGHFNAYGFSENPSPNYTQGDAYEQLAYAREKSRILAVNHPTLPHCSLRLNPYRTLELVNAFEAWNGPMSSWNIAAIEMWEVLLRQGVYLPLLAGSDFHSLGGDREPGSPSAWIIADTASERDLVTAMSRGHLLASKDPHTPVLLPWMEENGIRKFPGDIVSGGEIRLTPLVKGDVRVEMHTDKSLAQSMAFPSQESSIAWPETAKYVWFKLFHDHELVGITNPLRRA